MAKLNPKTLTGARKAALPNFIAPQLATLVDDPPSGDDWLHELKFDGYRMLCRIDRGKVQFWSRNGKEWTAKFPNVALAVKTLPAKTAILDGEIVILEANGRSSFQKLQRAMKESGSAQFFFEVFDLIYLDGFDLTRAPLIERKLLLERLCKSRGTNRVVRYSAHVRGNGDAFLASACKLGLEGIISKLADSTYETKRSKSWLKIKCNKEQEFVIAGYAPTSTSMPGFGSLILGYYDKGKLVYAGRVGTGFTFKQRAELKRVLDKLSRPESPFAITPRDPGLRAAVWAEPKLVGQVVFTEWTTDGSIRHPSFKGLREDKRAKDVVREVAKRKS